jgi:hypothetical protein
MANAKRCDICGEFYCVRDTDIDHWDEGRNSNMIRFLKLTDDRYIGHSVIHFDSCEKCFQDVMDYILAKQSAWYEENAN